MPPSPELRRGRASVTPDSVLRSAADRVRALLRHRRIVDYQHGVAATNEPIRLNEQLCLQWRRVPDASRNKMMQLVVIARRKPLRTQHPSNKKMMKLFVIARRKPLRHWLNALAIAGSDQPCHIKRTHSPPRFMAQAIQERLEPSSKLVFPIRRRAYHGRPSKSRPSMNH